jgi:hypothetical protein
MGDIMSTDTRELLKQALEELERYQVKRQDFERFADLITAIRAHLATPEQEPVARFNWNEGKFEWLTPYKYELHHMKPLYLSPTIPPGMVLVAEEPTEAMLRSVPLLSTAKECYALMLAAAKKGE